MRQLRIALVLKPMFIVGLAFMLGCGTAAVAQTESQGLDAFLDGAEKAMQDSSDGLRQKQSDKSVESQSDAIQKLEQYKKGYADRRDRLRPLTQRDLDDLLRQIEKAAREGDKETAQRLLDQLAQIMENLQLAQPGESGDSEMEEALNELGDMIRKQQQLQDKTFKEGQDARRDRSRGKQQGDQSMSELQQDQKALRKRLQDLQEKLAKRGLGQKGQKDRQGQQGQKGEQGQSGQSGDQDGDDGDDDGSLDAADSAMGDAGSKLGEGNADGAVESQRKALEALRKGAQKMAEAMQQGDGEGQGGPGKQAGRQQGGPGRTDPLGRPFYSKELDNDSNILNEKKKFGPGLAARILKELRNRLADPSRPQIERDYLERLLKDN